MSLLTDAEAAYRRQRAESKLFGAFGLRQCYRKLHARATNDDSVVLARLAALKDEMVLRNVEVPHVGPLREGIS